MWWYVLRLLYLRGMVDFFDEGKIEIKKDRETRGTRDTEVSVICY